MYESIQRIVKGEEPILPRGYTPLSAAELDSLEDTIVDPYLEKKISKRCGAHAILMAFHHGTIDTSVTKDQIIKVVRDLNLCDNEMDANWHQGREYGAWKAKDTLIRHGFLQEHKASIRMTDRGFRANGKHLYSITDAGRKAIQYLLCKWPDTRPCPRAGYSVNFGSSPASRSYLSPAGQSAASSLAWSADFITRIGPPAKKTKFSDDDERDLRQWLASASVLSQRVLNLGKQRRRYLHNLCDRLMEENPGLRIDHSSQGDRHGRHLYITVVSKPLNGIRSDSEWNPTVDSSFGTVGTPPQASARKRLFNDMTEGPGQRLGGVFSTAGPDVSAKEAAANAAIKRCQVTERDGSSRDRHPLYVASMHTPEVIEVIDDADADLKPASKRRRHGYDYQPGDKVIVMDSNGHTRGPLLIVRAHTSGHVTVRENEGHDNKMEVGNIRPYLEALDQDDEHGIGNPQSVSASMRYDVNAERDADDDGIIDLCDSQEILVSSIAYSPPGDLEAQTEPNLSEIVTIFIDSRERSRNSAPRELRMGLTKQVETGSLKDVWPAGRPTGKVVERQLCYGDFAFEVSRTNSEDKASRLSVVVERKLLRDLIQRSTRGDHWKQLQRMRDHCEHAIMLVENDTQLAARFDAYGSMGLEPNPSHHLIENDADVFRFMGRAILSSRNIRFIQTKDQNGSFRSIGALALIAAESKRIGRNAAVSPPTAASEQLKLQDRLTSGGIHWKVARAIVEEIGSVQALKSLYDSCSSSEAKKKLMLPILLNAVNQEELGSLLQWSTAVFLVVSANRECCSEKNARYQEIKFTFGDAMPCDSASMLVFVYEESSANDAVGKALEYGDIAIEVSIRRKVAIEISEDLKPFFPPPVADSFYTLSANPWGSSTVKLCTACGNIVSNSLYVYIIDGGKLLEYVETALGKSCNGTEDYVRTAYEVAKIVDDSFSFSDHSTADHRIILVRGLPPALTTAAKATLYRDEIRVVCELIFSCLMLEYNFVILQAIRKKDDETAMILQQLALACFHYQMITKDK